MLQAPRIVLGSHHMERLWVLRRFECVAVSCQCSQRRVCAVQGAAVEHRHDAVDQSQRHFCIHPRWHAELPHLGKHRRDAAIDGGQRVGQFKLVRQPPRVRLGERNIILNQLQVGDVQ